MEETLLELERAFWREGGNADFFRECLAADALMVFPAPFGLMGREATIEAVGESPGWTRFEIADSRVLEIGEHVAALAYRVSAVDANGDSYNAFISSVYTKEGDAWRLALHQQTPIGGQ
jgi:hypothetical protein